MTGKNYVMNVIKNMIKDTGARSKEDFIPFSKITVSPEEVIAVMETLTGYNNKDGNVWWAAGEQVKSFEEEFGKYIGAKYVIMTNCCTSALKLAYRYYKDKEYLKGYRLNNWNTFCATFAAAEEVGLNRYFRPFVRVNIHYGGELSTFPCHIEDSAHRIEKDDTWIGKIKCYSFYSTKNLSCGSGGALATNDKKIYEYCRLLWKDGLSSTTKDRSEGKGWDYKVKAFSGGYDSNDIAASIARVQLKKLPEFTKKRNEIRDHYNKELNNDWRGNHLYCLNIGKENIADFMSFMRKNGIQCGYHYPDNDYDYISLPIYPLLTDKEQDYIIEKVKEWKTTKQAT